MSGDFPEVHTHEHSRDLERRVTTTETKISHLDRSVNSIKTEQTRQGTVLDTIASDVKNQSSKNAANPGPGWVRWDSILKTSTLIVSIVVVTGGLGWTITGLVEENNKQADSHANEMSHLRDVHSRELSNLRDEFRTSENDTAHLQINERLVLAMDYMEKTYLMARERTEDNALDIVDHKARILALERELQAREAEHKKSFGQQAEIEHLKEDMAELHEIVNRTRPKPTLSPSPEPPVNIYNFND